LEKEELNRIIESLENSSSKVKASFGLHYRDGEDEMHIKANKDGFELFAAELLKVSRDSEDIIKNTEKNYIEFGYLNEWIDGELIAYIKPISENRNEIKQEEPIARNYKDDALQFGCILGIGILILSICVGFYTIVKWFV